MMNWETLAQTMPKEINGVPIDAAIITSEENCRYISGFHASARVVVVTREIAYLLTDFRYGEAARMQVKDCKVVVYQRLAKSIEEILRRHDIRGVLLEHENLTLAQADIYETVCKQWNAVPVKDTTLSMLMLDEPSMGLSPLLVQEIFDIIRNIHKEGMTILLVEQNAQMALSVADRAYVLETGRVVMEGTGAELLTNERVRSAYLGG